MGPGCSRRVRAGAAVATREVCGAVMDHLQAAETALRDAVDSLRRAVDLLREELILGQEPELLATLAVVTDANRSGIERMAERIQRARGGPA